MSYTFTVTNHPVITLENGNTDNTTSLTLVGKNYPNYGQLLQQDLINLLQNWAGTNQPSNAVVGQLWWNTTNSLLQVYTGATWKNISGVTSSTSAPTSNAIQGDLWYDITNQQLNIYTGSSWLLVGPQFTSSQQRTTAAALSITDNTSATHTVLAFYVGNFLTGILSKDPTFTPSVGIAGFTTVNPGYNINTTIFTGAIPLSGQLITNAQPYVTSLGTLTGLTVATPIVGSVLFNSNTVTYSNQANITALGTLTSLNVSGASILQSANVSTAVITSANVGTMSYNNRFIENTTTNSSVSSTYNVDWSTTSIYNLTLTGNTTITFSNPPSSGYSQTMTLVLKQDGTGSRTITWPASVRWSYSQTPVLTTAANNRDVFTFVTYDGGSTYLGAYSLANIAP